MKVLYFLIGLLAGIWFTTNQAYVVIESLEQKWDKEVLAFTLTGYSEGWERGRDYADKQNGWYFHMCMKELKRYQNAK